MTEQELIAGVASENKDAVRFLVNKYQESVIKTAYYFVSDMQDAEDLSQEVFLEIMRSISTFKKQASLGTWVYRITVNKSLDHVRKKQRRGFLQNMGTLFSDKAVPKGRRVDEPKHTDSVNEDKERREILDQAVNSLPDNQKIAFVLSKYEELSYKEIAEVMNVSVSSVESLIHRAKISLQKKLVHYFSEYDRSSK